MNIIQRAKAPTPKFFRIVRSIGLVLTAASAAVLTAPIALPAIALSIAGYAAVAGTVMTAISQVTVDTEAMAADSNGGGTGIPGKI